MATATRARRQQSRRAPAQSKPTITPEQREERAEALEPAVRDSLAALAAEPPAPILDEILGAAAEDFAPDQHNYEQGDVTRLIAAEIAKVYQRFGLTPPGSTNEIEERLTAVVGDAPVRPEGILPPAEEERRLAETRALAERLMATSSGKRQAYLRALRDSAPCTVYAPEAHTFQINSVVIDVPEGETPPKAGNEIGLGCAMVRELVEEYFRRRSWEMAERRRMHEQIISDSSHEAAQAAARRARPGGIF